MQNRNWNKIVAALLLGGGIAAGSIYAAPRDERPDGNRSESATTTVRGRVEKVLKNEPGDVDGLLLDDGTEIHFPPHIGTEVARSIRPGSRVEVEGMSEVRPEGETVFEASSLTSEGKTITVSRPRPHRGPNPGPRREAPVTATGTVREFALNPEGDADGLILDDGTEVKFHPHLADGVRSIVAKGEKVRIEGRPHETPRGETHLHADRITAVSSGREIVRSEERAEGRPPRPRLGKAGPEERPAPVSNEEILKELRAIRRLLEERRS